MKTFALSMLISLAATAACTSSKVASEPESQAPVAERVEPVAPTGCDTMGKDRETFLDNFAIATMLMQQKDYQYAKPAYLYILKNGPGYDERIHWDAIEMYKALADKETDPKMKEALIDTVFMLYDKSVDCFGNACYMLGRKAYDMMRYRNKDVKGITKLLEKVFEFPGYCQEYFLMETHVKLQIKKYREDEEDVEDLLELYDELNKIAQENINKGNYPDEYKLAIDQIFAIYKAEGIFQCDILVPIFEKVYKKSQGIPEVLKEVYNGTKACGCDNITGTIMDAYIAYYKVEPSQEVAERIAGCLVKDKKYDKALPYLLDLADKYANTADDKAKQYYNIAQIYYKNNSFSTARTYAQKAIDLKSNWGDPYILIGNMYASSGKSCGPGTGYQSQIVLFPAFDMWEKAKAVDPSAASEAQSQMNKYCQYLPSKADIFQMGKKAGDAQTVECWIQRTSTIRTKCGE